MKKGESKRKKAPVKIEKKEEKKDFRPTLIFWEAPEFKYRQKDFLWYFLMNTVGVIFILLALWQKNFLFIIFIVIAWFVIMYWANKKPTIWKFKIDEKGIYVILPGEKSEKLYEYAEISGFDIHEGAEKNKELLLRLKTKLSPYLKIIFPETKEKEITDFLAGFLTREEYEKTASDSFFELIGF